MFSTKIENVERAQFMKSKCSFELTLDYNNDQTTTTNEDLTTSETRITVTDSTSGVGSVTDASLLPTGLQIPVQFIPANSSSIPASTPGTIINIVLPEITVAPIGTTPPPTIPLNSLTPTIFDQTPSTVAVTSSSS